MTAAIYARKSTDQNGVSEEQKSVGRQIERAKAYAHQKGWTVSEDYTFVDDGIGGAEFARRPGFVRLMNALKPSAPFQVLIMSEESRLGREMIEVGYALKQILAAGVQVWFYLEDRRRTLNSAIEKAMLSFQTMADEMERERARLRTYDAMERKARAGHATGGRVFGYENIEVKDAAGKRSHVELKIREHEAAVVRRIFQLRAEGFGAPAIAKTLNAERAPSPRAQRGRPTGWADNSVREILRRPLYRGIKVWNQTSKRDKAGQVNPQPRPEREHIRTALPHLRIVSDELWESAHACIEADRARYPGVAKGRPGRQGGYLLTGMARCARCNGGIEAETRNHGTNRAVFYSCARAKRSGPHVCDNRLAIRAETVDAAVLAMMESAVLAPDVCERAIRDATERLTPQRDQAARVERDIRELQQRAERLADQIEAGQYESSTLAARLRKIESQIAERQAFLQALDRVARFDPAQIRRTLEAKIQDWRALLRGEPEAGRRALRALIEGQLIFTPKSDQEGDLYEITGVAALQVGKTLVKVASPTGFEPVFWP